MGALPIELWIFCAIMLPVATWVVVQGSSKRKLEKRIRNLHKDGKPSTMATGTSTSLRRKKGDDSLPLINRLAQRFNPELLRDRLEQAGLKLSAEKYIAICISLFALTILLCVIINKNIWLAIFSGIIIGVGFPHFYVTRRVRKRLKQFLILFPDALDLIIRGLRSGLPVTESIHVVAQEVTEPVGPVFSSMSDAMKLGVPLEKILSDTARKLNLTEFNFFVTTIILQRETGGNLSEILNNLSEVLRSRITMQLKIRAITSEARASAMILGALPFCVALILHISSPDYLEPLFTDYRGNIAAACAALSLITGIGIMMKMSKVEI